MLVDSTFFDKVFVPCCDPHQNLDHTSTNKVDEGLPSRPAPLIMFACLGKKPRSSQRMGAGQHSSPSSFPEQRFGPKPPMISPEIDADLWKMSLLQRAFSARSFFELFLIYRATHLQHENFGAVPTDPESLNTLVNKEIKQLTIAAFSYYAGKGRLLSEEKELMIKTNGSPATSGNRVALAADAGSGYATDSTAAEEEDVIVELSTSGGPSKEANTAAKTATTAAASTPQHCFPKEILILISSFLPSLNVTKAIASDTTFLTRYGKQNRHRETMVWYEVQGQYQIEKASDFGRTGVFLNETMFGDGTYARSNIHILDPAFFEALGYTANFYTDKRNPSRHKKPFISWSGKKPGSKYEPPEGDFYATPVPAAA